LEEAKREEQRKKSVEMASPHFTVDGQKLLAILAELNKVRVSPKLYAKYLQELLDENNPFSGKTFKIPGTNVTRETQEGEDGFRKAIEFLKGAQRLKMFIHSDGFSQSCYDLIRNNNLPGLTGSKLSDGTSSEDRLNHYGKVTQPYEELLIYGFETPNDLVLQWIIDDGDFSRRRRNILLNEKYSTIGISVGPHSKFKEMCACAFCVKFEENSSE